MVHPMRIWGHKHLRFVTHCHGRIAVFCSWDPDYSPRSACPPERSSESHSTGHLQVLIFAKVTVSPLFLIGEVEKNTHGVIPRMANSILHQRRSTPGRFSIEPSVSSSYGMDVIALTGMSRSGPKTDIPQSGKSGQGEQARSAGGVGIGHGVMWD
jgi:hypothetical protein